MENRTKLQFKLITPVETLYEQEVDQVIIPTTSGQITVLPHHTELVSILAPGELIIGDGTDQFPLAVTGGVLEISKNVLTILADSAEQPSDIDIEAAEKRANALAEELSTQEQMDITTYNLLVKQLQQEQARLSVGKKWRK